MALSDLDVLRLDTCTAVAGSRCPVCFSDEPQPHGPGADDVSAARSYQKGSQVSQDFALFCF